MAQRYENDQTGFEQAVFEPEATVPVELFDSVLDNLLQNAFAKRQNEGGLRINVSLNSDASALHVGDSGSPVHDPILADLLLGPVVSDNGLGIGLYNAARQAEGCGYQLRLSSNVAGSVCFELSRSS